MPPRRRKETSGDRERNIRSSLIKRGAIRYGNFTLASGAQANRKIDLKVMYEDETIERRVTKELAKRAIDLAEMAKKPFPDLIIPVPKGANRIGALVAKKLDIEVVVFDWLDKTPGKKRVDVEEELVEGFESVVIIEDVLSTGESSHAIASHPYLRGKVSGVVSVWSRLREHERIQVDYPRLTIVEDHVPFLDRTEAAHG